jgi:hypothetical protein
MATWRRGYDVSESVKRDSQEWEEHWNVLNYEPPVGQPAWYGLLNERPDLAPGAQHPIVLSAYVDDFSPERVTPGADAWDVTVRYASRRDDTQINLPPTMRPAIIDATHESVEAPTFTKADGSFWRNTAGDLISGITKVENHWVFSVQKNVAQVPQWFLDYANAVNSDAVNLRGLAVLPHYLLLKEPRIPLNPTTEQVNGINYNFYPLTFSLLYNPRTWKTKVFNRGLWEKHPTDGYRRITDDEDEPVEEPQFLDEDGAALPLPVADEDIIVLEGWDYDLKPFAALPLT